MSTRTAADTRTPRAEVAEPRSGTTEFATGARHGLMASLAFVLTVALLSSVVSVDGLPLVVAVAAGLGVVALSPGAPRRLTLPRLAGVLVVVGVVAGGVTAFVYAAISSLS